MTGKAPSCTGCGWQAGRPGELHDAITHETFGNEYMYRIRTIDNADDAIVVMDSAQLDELNRRATFARGEQHRVRTRMTRSKIT